MNIKYLASSNLGFSITGAKGSMAIDVGTTFYNVTKTSVDLRATGPIGAGFYEYGIDLGSAIVNGNPFILKDLPPGIVEVLAL